MKATLLAALITLAGASLVLAESPAAPQTKATPTSTPSADTLGFIETRDYSIEIKAGETGASTHLDTVRTKDGTILSNVVITTGEPGAYTVRTKEGKILAENISASQLQAKFPGLERVVSGVAENYDARLNLNPSAFHIMHPSDSYGGETSFICRPTWNTDAMEVIHFADGGGQMYQMYGIRSTPLTTNANIQLSEPSDGTVARDSLPITRDKHSGD
jgi:hypothetical protein